MSPAYRMLVRMQGTRGRLAATAGLGALTVFIGIAVRVAGDVTTDRALDVVSAAGLALFVPLISLVFATAVLGDPVEDGTLVYIWMRPLARWRLALAATGASLTFTLPVVLVVTALMTLAMGATDSVGGAVVAAGLATITYTAVFVGLGLKVRRALVWGLLYIIVFEGIIASVGSTLARFSIRLHVVSVMRELAAADPADFAVGATTAGVVLAIVAALGVLATNAFLVTDEVA